MKGWRGRGTLAQRGGRGSAYSVLGTDRSALEHIHRTRILAFLSEPVIALSLFLVVCGVSSKFPGDMAAAGLGASLRKAETKGPLLEQGQCAQQAAWLPSSSVTTHMHTEHIHTVLPCCASTDS